MNDSGSFSSLLALVDSHLSQCNMQDKGAINIHEHTSRTIAIPLNNEAKSGLSDPRLAPSNQMHLQAVPGMSVSPIKSVLNEQVLNMLKAKEKKREHRESLEAQLNELKLQEEEPVIDLMKALEAPVQIPEKKNVLSRSSSTDSFNIYNHFPLKDVDEDEIEETEKLKTKLLPCIRDISHILYKRIRRGRCSDFGKVLSARLRPVAAPYFREITPSPVVPFDFKTKSPCDVIKDKLHRNVPQTAYDYICSQMNEQNKE